MTVRRPSGKNWADHTVPLCPRITAWQFPDRSQTQAVGGCCDDTLPVRKRAAPPAIALGNACAVGCHLLINARLK